MASPLTSSRPTAPPALRRIHPADSLQGPRKITVWLQRLTQSGASLDLLYGAFNESNKLTAAALMVPQPGRTGLIFTAPATRSTAPALATLLDACCRQAPPDRVKLAQALLLPSEQHESAAFLDAGFRHITSLAYMHGQLPPPVTQPPLPAGVELCPYQPALEETFRQTLEATYHGSLDCPALRPLRQTTDVMAGHRAVGAFDPALWTLALIDHQPAALLLLNRVPPAQCVELVYMGVTPQYRRRGLGALLLRHALARLAHLGESHITLAADQANTPALALYRSVGFQRNGEREVFVRPLL